MVVDAGDVGWAAGVSLVGDACRTGHLRLRQPGQLWRDDIASVVFGPMYEACIRIVHHKAARLCDRCSTGSTPSTPASGFAVGNQHPPARSHVLDTYVDLAILPFLEGFSQH
ncbi:MAG: hypothetical protein LC808_21270, partial [Actinobacteria bacterium]|nr:hypothetical protein [Actinomycetota bacterium]